MNKPKPEPPKGITFIAIYEPDLKAQVEALRKVLRSRTEKEASNQ
jgi:hypothetical protein